MIGSVREPRGGHGVNIDVINLIVRQRTWAALVVVACVTAMVPACGGGATIVDCVVGAHNPPGREDICVPDAVPQAIRTRLFDVARTSAQENDGTVKRAVAVEALRSDAVRYSGGSFAGGDGLVWFVEVSGDFRCGTACVVPSTNTIRRGKALTLDVAFKTYEVTDLSLRRTWIDPSHLGEIVALGPSRRR